MLGVLLAFPVGAALGQQSGAQRLQRIAALAGKGMSAALVDSMASLPYDVLSSDLDGALALLRQACTQARTSTDPERLGDLLLQMSTAHYLQGGADSATHYGLMAIESYRRAGAVSKECHAQCALAYNMKRRDLATSFDLMRQGIGCLERIGATEMLASDYNKFGVLHEMAGALDSARYFYRRSLRLKEEIGDTLGVPFSMNCLGTVEHMLGAYASAEEWFTRALELRRRRGDHFGVAEEMLYFGELYEAWGREESAITAYEDALLRTRDVGYPRGRQQALERLSALYERSGRLPEALSMAREASGLKDSLLDAERARTVLDLEQRYRVAEKDRDLHEAMALSEKRRLLAWVMGIGSLLLLAIGALWFQKRKGTIRAERDAAVIAERERGLRRVFEATEEERSRLARELHDGIGQQLGGLKHRLEHARTRTGTESLAEAVSIVDDTAEEVRSLAHQLMPRALSRLGLVPAIQDLLKRTFEGTPVKAVFEHTGIQDEMTAGMAMGLYRITQELISNVLKHAAANTVDVQLLRNRGHIILIVQDDGMGIGPDPGGQGIGLKSMQDRARALGGTFVIERAGERGTVATVRVPLQGEV